MILASGALPSALDGLTLRKVRISEKHARGSSRQRLRCHRATSLRIDKVGGVAGSHLHLPHQSAKTGALGGETAQASGHGRIVTCPLSHATTANVHGQRTSSGEGDGVRYDEDIVRLVEIRMVALSVARSTGQRNEKQPLNEARHEADEECHSAD